MTTKAVIEIDILDEKFKAFEAALEKLQEVVGKLPSDWKKVTSEIGNANKELGKGEKEAEKDERKRKDRDTKKRYEENRDNNQRKKNNEDQRVAQNNALQQYREVFRVTGGIAKNLASGALSVAKWVTLGAIGGGFGFGGLAAAASNARKEAGGLGVSTGELRAANVAYGRYLDNPEQSLGNIAQMQQDYLGRAKLNRIAGKDVSQETSGQALTDTLQNAVKMYQANKNNLPYLQSMGVTDVYSLQELRRLAALPEKERNEAISQYGSLSKKYAVADPTSKAWQDFMVKLQDAGQTIEVSFIKNLKNITPALDTLTTSISKAIDEFLSSKQFGDAVKTLSTKIVEFGKYLGSAEFQDDISKFMSSVGKLVDYTEDFVGWLDKVTGKKHFEEQSAKQEATKEENRTSYDKGNVIQKGLAWLNMDKQSQTVATNKNLQATGREYIDYLAQKGWTKEQAAGIVGNLAQESSLNPAAQNKEGMSGLAQWDTKRRAEFQKMYGVPVQQATWKQQLDFVNYELTQGKEQGAGQALKKATTAQEAAKVVMEKYERPGDNSGLARANYAASFLHYTPKEQPAPQVAVNVPDQKAPVVNVPAQQPPVVNVPKQVAEAVTPVQSQVPQQVQQYVNPAAQKYAAAAQLPTPSMRNSETSSYGPQASPVYVNSMPRVQVSVNTQAGANVFATANALPGGSQ